RIDADQFSFLFQPNQGVEGVVLQFADNHFFDRSLQAHQEHFDQVVRHGPGGGHFFDLQRDGVSFIDADPDRQYGIPRQVFEDHNRHIGHGVHHETTNFHFYFHVSLHTVRKP